jgi:hypothetical protein
MKFLQIMTFRNVGTRGFSVGVKNPRVGEIDRPRLAQFAPARWVWQGSKNLADLQTVRRTRSGDRRKGQSV